MDDYKSKIEAFVTYPWQEDDEIDFVRLISQYWGGQERSAAPQFWRDYIRRLVQTNPVIMKSQTVTDKFIGDLQELIGTEKGVFSNRLSEALGGVGVRFDTIRDAQDFAGNSHKYYFVCENCGNKMTCRCSQHKTKVMVGSCHNCDGSRDDLDRAMGEGTYASDSDANIGGIAGGIDPRIKQQGETAVKRLKLKSRGKNEFQRPTIKRA